MLDALQNFLIYAGAFVLVLSVVVFVHEFGHFQAARWSKVAIDTFSIGFGKALLSWRDKHGVDWKIGALPLGGYVKFKGDADAISSKPQDPEEQGADLAAARKAGLFHAQPVGVRAFVFVAGPLANFIFSILVFALGFMLIGKNYTDYAAQPARIGVVAEGSAAATAGLKAGDIVIAVNDQSIQEWGAFQKIIQGSADTAMRLQVSRDGAAVSLIATPKSATRTDPRTGVDSKIGLLGVGPAPIPRDQLDIRKLNPIAAIGAGAQETWGLIASTVSYIGNILTGQATAKHLSGPLGIADQSGKVLQGSWGDSDAQLSIWERLGSVFVGLATWAAILSVAVGFVNLLPVPVLDGGHLLFYCVEAVRGRPLSARAQEIGFQAGFAVLISLFLFATWNDVQRLLGS
ncbi:MAG: RIP metalloprotease RseP [Caulobacterales bacterium]